MKKIIPVLVALILMIVIGLGFIGKEVVDKYSYSKEQVNMDDFYKVSGDLCAIIYQNEQIEEYAKVRNEVSYMKLEDIQKYLNAGFYYDKAEDLLLYTDGVGTNKTVQSAKEYVASDMTTVSVPYEIYFMEGETCYIALDYVKRFTNFNFERFGNHLEMDNTFASYEMAVIEKDTQIRLKGGVKSPVLRQVKAGEKVEILEPMENWCKVKTTDAIIGYIELKRMSDAQPMTRQKETGYAGDQYQTLSTGEKIGLGFHAIGGVGGNTTLETMAAEGTAMNIIAPTWFSLNDEEGGFRNFGESSYVDRAHNMGLQVWGVLDDFNYPAEAGISISDYAVLNRTSSRTRLVSGIVGAAVDLGLDGINLDFEKLDASCSEPFAQFLRELSVECHKAGLILSADNYVPFHFNEFMRLDVQGAAVDYVIIMGYDEHWHGSKDPGSVASLPYITGGITKTLEKVPAEKVVNALPFYTIMWTTEGANVTDEYLTLNNTADFLSRINKTPVWDETAGQNYLEWESGNKTYQIWLEDVQSIQTKLNTMSSHNIGGFAVWRLGYGTPEVWDLLKLYMSI